jgi:hypothetical protein
MIEKVRELRLRRSKRKRSIVDTILFSFTKYIPLAIIALALMLSGYCFNCFYDGDQLGWWMKGLFGIAATGGLWMLYATLSINLSFRKSGLGTEENRAKIDMLLRQQYRDFHFHLRESELLCIRLWTPEKTGKEIRIDFRNNAILVNIKTYLMYGHVQSHYHVLANQRETLQVLRMFSQKLATENRE